MELNFLRIFSTLFNIGLLILIIYLIFKFIIKIRSSFNRLERMENKLNEISDSIKEKNKQS